MKIDVEEFRNYWGFGLCAACTAKLEAFDFFSPPFTLCAEDEKKIRDAIAAGGPAWQRRRQEGAPPPDRGEGD